MTKIIGTTQKVYKGVLLSAAVGVVAMAMQFGEERLFGHAWLEGLVIAILLGIILRAYWTPDENWIPGIKFSAKPILEMAVVLLGASVNASEMLKAGPLLAASIVGVVILGITFGTLIGRFFGLDPKHAVLVACGNSICGNSAIAALAPVIEAKDEHVVSSITFTAVMSIVVVVALPLLYPVMKLTFYQYGILTGLGVYAVPQVLAAASINPVSVQMGTLVKLVRVLMLGPVVFFMALFFGSKGNEKDKSTMTFGKMVPWFVIGFMLLGFVRSMGWLTPDLANYFHTGSVWLTIIAMAALGLDADIRVVSRMGKPLLFSVVCSMSLLLMLGWGVIHLLKL